jgi:hypothetical protein
MKKLVACLAVLAMMSAMVSCEKTNKKNGKTSANNASSAAEVTSEKASNESETTTDVQNKDNDKKSGTANDENSNTIADTNNNNSNAENNDVSEIVGTWYEENALDSRSLTVNADGTYQLAYRGGGSRNGSIRIERQVLGTDGQVNIWYCFCDNENTELSRFRVVQGDDMATRLCSGFDETSMSFISAADISQISQVNNSDPKPVDRFIGGWDCGRCHIVISNIRPGNYSVDIHWSSSASEGCDWSYLCTYNEANDELVCEGMGICTEYADIGESTESMTKKYADGSAVFNIIDNGNLTWHDYYANQADGMEFTRS